MDSCEEYPKKFQGKIVNGISGRMSGGILKEFFEKFLLNFLEIRHPWKKILKDLFQKCLKYGFPKESFEKFLHKLYEELIKQTL